MPLDLTIAIPAHNDTSALATLLGRLAALDLAREIIVADDGSEPAIDPEQAAHQAGLPAKRVQLLRRETPAGAGAARNQALQAVRTRHMLFLDADDLPTRELAQLCQALEGEAFDFCIFQHHDSRMARDGLWGQMPHDQQLWDQAGLAQGALLPVDTAARQLLAQTANYPWNKICRTGFLHRNDITCTEIAVHNDIELHWRSFLEARRILASDHVGVVHYVAENGSRLTNRFGPERLQVFEALSCAARAAAAHPEHSLELPFFSFALGLLAWIEMRLQPELLPRFAAAAAAFLQTHLPHRLRRPLCLSQPEAWQRTLAMIAAHAPAALAGLDQATEITAAR